MDEKGNTNQVTEVKDLKETKTFSKTKDVISKNNSKTEIELITAYAQLAFHTLKNSNTDITAKSIKEEVTMFYKSYILFLALSLHQFHSLVYSYL